MFGNIFYRDFMPQSIADLICHSSGYLIPEIPQLVAFGKQRESGTQTELSFFCYFVVQKVRKINVWSDRYRFMLPCHILAKAPGFSDVFIHIATKC